MKRLSVLVAVVLVVLMVHARWGSAVGVSPLASCTPDCLGVDDNVKIPDPYNCTQFYVCFNDVQRGPYPCDPGNEFSETDGQCVSSGAEECSPICGGANCPLTCNGTVVSIGDAFDCSTYYYCTVAGPSDPLTCDDTNPYYDGNTGSCSKDESVCCMGYCTAYCSGPGLTPDPNSCTGYYYCAEEGDVNELYYDTCPSGQVFSVGYGDCVTDTGEPCITLCSVAGGGGGGGSSTSTTTSTTTTSGGGGGGTTDINGCVESLVCTGEGRFPACSTCQPEYFVCSAAGATGEPASCDDGYVFNTNPDYPNCILPSHCPTS